MPNVIQWHEDLETCGIDTKLYVGQVISLRVAAKDILPEAMVVNEYPMQLTDESMQAYLRARCPHPRDVLVFRHIIPSHSE